MIITIMAQNVARGAMFYSNGKQKDRWPQLAERINSINPDVLLLTELNNWADYGHKALVRAANDLDMDVAPLSPSPSGFATGLLFNRERMGRWQMHNPNWARETTHGFAVTGFEVGLPALLHITPTHLCPFSVQKAAQEAQLISTITYGQSPFAIIGGDCNFVPADDYAPDYKFSKPFNLSARTIIESGDPVDTKDLVPDRRVAWTFQRAGYVDVAKHLYEKTGNKTFLLPTAVTDERIDQFWVSQPIAPALKSYKVTNLNANASDHAGIAIKIDTDKIDITHLWKPDVF